MLTAFTAGLLLVTVSELGDKTFFIAAVLAMRHARRWVFVGAIAALATMTILSVLLGQTASLVPLSYVKVAEIVLFLGFGLKLLYDASRMPAGVCLAEQQAAMDSVERAAGHLIKVPTQMAIVAEAFTLTFMAEWGDRTQFTTIALAAANNPIGVAVGAVLGHGICAAIAVIAGRMVCNYISERAVTAIGGGLFLIFAAVGGVRLLTS